MTRGRKKGCLGLRGDKHPNSKLSNLQRRQIRVLGERGASPALIRVWFPSVGVTTIRSILTSEFDYAD